MDLEFAPLYYEDRLKYINPKGDIAIVSLWSKVDKVHEVMSALGLDLNSNSSRVVVMSNLYGLGLPELLRDLLYNPQIRYIIACGRNIKNAWDDLVGFFEGVTEEESLGRQVLKINSTGRVLDNKIKPEDFEYSIEFHNLGTITDIKDNPEAIKFIDNLPIVENNIERKNIPLSVEEATRFPSNILDHNIVREYPLDAWEELIFRLVNFGIPVTLSKGDRIELINTKVVITNPIEEPDEYLSPYGFSLDEFKLYQERIVNPIKPNDLSYTYGNRLRGYFKNNNGDLVDSLIEISNRLLEDSESRYGYTTLWNPGTDLFEHEECPCFVTCFFRKVMNKLSMTVTFRAHNAVDAWLENVYGLIAIQRLVSEKVGIEAGPITVISHSISVDPKRLDFAKSVMQNKQTHDIIDRSTGKRSLRMDPNGYFAITTDDESKEIVVIHYYEDVPLRTYRGKSAEELTGELSTACAVSDIQHAMYIGRELARAEYKIKDNNN